MTNATHGRTVLGVPATHPGLVWSLVIGHFEEPRTDAAPAFPGPRRGPAAPLPARAEPAPAVRRGTELRPRAAQRPRRAGAARPGPLRGRPDAPRRHRPPSGPRRRELEGAAHGRRRPQRAAP